MAIAVHKQGNGTVPVPPVEFDHEELVVRRGRRSGVQCVVAVHSTALGPALGGLRIWHYSKEVDGVRDAMRLAAAMTLKAAAAGLGLGGGKGVICAPLDRLEGEQRRAALLDFGDLVASLNGRYITAEDVGTSPEDLLTVRERSENVAGLPPSHGGSGDPSPFTAIGVQAAMRASARARFGTADLAGLRVVVVGLGHVGAELARGLTKAGCQLAVTDIKASRRALADELGAHWIDVEDAITTEGDILAPCALGGAIDADNAGLLRCSIVCGSANNQLAEDGLAEVLADGGVLYAPDFIANAGGLIHVYRELKGYSEDRAIALAEGIEATLDRVFSAAEERGATPLAAAGELARERLRAAMQETATGTATAA